MHTIRKDPRIRGSGWVLRVLASCLGTYNPVVPGCSCPLCYSLDLFSVALTSTCWLCSVKSQFGCLLLVGVLKNCVDVYLLCLYPILFELIISKICKQIKNREIYHTTNYYYYYYLLLWLLLVIIIIIIIRSLGIYKRVNICNNFSIDVFDMF